MNGRYSRQELFAPIGREGQRKMENKHVLVVGAGALGTGSAEMLVRAGIGKLTIVDRDYVEWSNLQRQQLYTEADAEQRTPKAVAAKARLSLINSEVEVRSLIMDVSVEEMEQLVEGIDLIIDASDNFDIRMIVNDISQKHRIPWIYSACVGSYGISYAILPGKTPCLSCLLEEVPMGGITCDTVGIINPAVQMVLSLQISEALKILVEDSLQLSNKLVSFDLWKNQYSSITVDKVKKEDCPSCGLNRSYPYLSFENQTKTAILCGRDTVQIRPSQQMDRDLENLEGILSELGVNVSRNPYLLSFSTAQHRLVVFKDGRVLVHGTKNIIEAKTLYHRYLG
ncbi:thiazole biosynthesis adenylyltransferase ThiF [uncultured Planococcus sp.]|uniref:thiazole biosynthesis adenylyltransferase ThiF n=1 Tax=uncultured Planococcus sp. TaxID=337815 RepID=UPI00260D094D|nr:thiazole biosynthesis adenylyltransferase ThiF [uncultured Planococcus sp.]